MLDNIKHDNLRGFLRQAKAEADDLNESERSRALSLVITKIEEALLWQSEDVRLKTDPVNEETN